MTILPLSLLNCSKRGLFRVPEHFRYEDKTLLEYFTLQWEFEYVPRGNIMWYCRIEPEVCTAEAIDEEICWRVEDQEKLG